MNVKTLPISESDMDRLISMIDQVRVLDYYVILDHVLTFHGYLNSEEISEVVDYLVITFFHVQ